MAPRRRKRRRLGAREGRRVGRHHRAGAGDAARRRQAGPPREPVRRLDPRRRIASAPRRTSERRHGRDPAVVDGGRTWAQPETPSPTSFDGRRGTIYALAITPARRDTSPGRECSGSTARPFRATAIFNPETEGCLPMRILLADSEDRRPDVDAVARGPDAGRRRPAVAHLAGPAAPVGPAAALGRDRTRSTRPSRRGSSASCSSTRPTRAGRGRRPSPSSGTRPVGSGTGTCGSRRPPRRTRASCRSAGRSTPRPCRT